MILTMCVIPASEPGSGESGGSWRGSRVEPGMTGDRREVGHLDQRDQASWPRSRRSATIWAYILSSMRYLAR